MWHEAAGEVKADSVQSHNQLERWVKPEQWVVPVESEVGQLNGHHIEQMARSSEMYSFREHTHLGWKRTASNWKFHRMRHCRDHGNPAETRSRHVVFLMTLRCQRATSASKHQPVLCRHPSHLVFCGVCALFICPKLAGKKDGRTAGRTDERLDGRNRSAKDGKVDPYFIESTDPLWRLPKKRSKAYNCTNTGWSKVRAFS